MASNPARGQLNRREPSFLPVLLFAPDKRVSRDTGSVASARTSSRRRMFEIKI